MSEKQKEEFPFFNRIEIETIDDIKQRLKYINTSIDKLNDQKESILKLLDSYEHSNKSMIDHNRSKEGKYWEPTIFHKNRTIEDVEDDIQALNREWNFFVKI